MDSKKPERNIKLDLIRFIGVLIIMIAHANPPEWLFQLRNFGTPLLILGSAVTYSFIYRERNLDRPFLFFNKRLKRLIIPAWIFLTFFFSLFFILFSLAGKTFPYTHDIIIESYTFYKGIGYVWIFKVYIILALLTPLGLKFSKSSISNTNYFLLLILLYSLYELGIAIFLNTIPYTIKEFVSNLFLVLIPYSILYLYGLRIHRINHRTLIIMMICSLIIFICLALQKYFHQDVFITTQHYKYPPQLYYLSYAFFFINLIYYVIHTYFSLSKKWLQKAIVWLSSNSLWIYLWHIIAVFMWDILFKYSGLIALGSFSIFTIKFLFLLLYGIILTYLQTTIISKIITKCHPLIAQFLAFLK